MKPFLIGPVSDRISSGRASNPDWLVIQAARGYNALHKSTGQFERLLPAALNHSAQIVFDWTDPNTLLYISGTTLFLYDVKLDVSKPLKGFPEYASLASHHAEGDLQRSGWLALCGVKEDGSETVFSYNVMTDETGPKFLMIEAFDALKVAEDGTLLVSGRDITAFPQIGFAHPVTSANGHACPCVDKEGRSKLLFCNSNENPITLPDLPNAVVMVDIETGKQTGLKSFDWAYAMHISAGPDFAIVSVYDDPKSPVTKGLAYQIWRVPFEGTDPKMLHEWTGPYNGDYQPRATYSDGREKGQGLILYNVWDGKESNVWGLKLDGVATPPHEKPKPKETRIDYSAYLKREFVMRPRPDGAIDIFEREKQ